LGIAEEPRLNRSARSPLKHTSSSKMSGRIYGCSSTGSASLAQTSRRPATCKASAKRYSLATSNSKDLQAQLQETIQPEVSNARKHKRVASSRPRQRSDFISSAKDNDNDNDNTNTNGNGEVSFQRSSGLLHEVNAYIVRNYLGLHSQHRIHPKPKLRSKWSQEVASPSPDVQQSS
jgi:hypothetical protein